MTMLEHRNGQERKEKKKQKQKKGKKDGWKRRKVDG